MKKIAILLSFLITNFLFSQSSDLVLINGHLSSGHYMSKLRLSKQELNTKTKQYIEGVELQSYTIKKPTYDAISLSSLNEQNGINIHTPVMVNGLNISDTSMLVVINGFDGFKIETNQGQKVIHISSENK